MARTFRSRLMRRSTVIAVFISVLASSTMASAAFSGVGNTATGSYTAGTINPPTAFATSSVAPTSVLISWTAPTSPSETSYTLSQSPGTIAGCSATPTAGTTSCTASGLTPNTLYTWTLTAFYNNWQSTSVTVSVTTPKATPTITTASNPASDTVGGSVDDQAFVAGGYDPTGTITWSLYNNSGCTGTAVFSTSTGGPVNGDSTYSSAYYTTTAAATYTWGFNYVGDTHNFGVSACGGTGETLTVNQATPTLSTSASSGGNVFGTVSDSATLAGGYNPTGTITYTLYGPSATQSCTTQVGQVISTVNSGNGTYTSPTITPPQAGTYWWIANYGGDSNNAQTTNGCGESGESSVVNPVTPTITTSASPATVTEGGSVMDKATITVGYSPTGTITWSLYNNSGCTGTVVFTSTGQTVSGNATYTSSPYTTTAAGTYTWGFLYTGDVNNNQVSACGGTGETLTVQNATSLTSLTAPASDTTNTAISGSSLGVTLSGGTASPAVSGAITFSVFGPQTSAPTPCTGVGWTTLTPTTTVSGNNTYAGSASASFTPTSPGTYWWYASYGGDTYNVGSSTLCGSGMTSTVVQTTTTTALSNVTPTIGSAGSAFSATATVTGTSLTGTVTFALYNNSGCTGGASYTTSALTLVSGAVTGSLNPTTPGTYYWQGVYSGDTYNFASISTSCSSSVITVYAADGSGMLTTPTTNVAVSSTGNTIVFTYTAPTGGLLNGEVDITVPSDWTAPVSTNAIGCTTVNHGTLGFSGQIIKVSALTLAATNTLTVTYGATTGGSCTASDGATATSSLGAQTWQGQEKSTLAGTPTNISPSPSITVAGNKLVITSAAVSGSSSSTPNLGPITVQRQNGAGTPLAPATSLTVTLSSSPSSGATFGTSQFGSSVVPIPASASSATFWYGLSTTGSPTITASAAGFTSGTQGETITTAPAGLSLTSITDSGGTITCANPVSDATSCTGTMAMKGSFTAKVDFVNSSSSPVVYSATQDSSIAGSMNHGAITGFPLTVTHNTTTSTTTFEDDASGSSGVETTITFGPYTININITS